MLDAKHRVARECLMMSLYSLGREGENEFAQVIGRDVLMRLGDDGFTPDVFAVGPARVGGLNRHYLDGPADLVIEVLSPLVSTRGAPRYLRSDNGPEFVSKALLSWIVAQGIGTALIEPGKPWQNGVTESFNGKFRDECLSLEWFRSRAEAKVIIEAAKTASAN